jgi:hypothetical protein
VPNLGTHVALAARWADGLGHDLPREWVAPYLLGATAPDMRAMTHGRREDTHFMGLDAQGMTAGVEGLFAAHPVLGNGSGVNEPTCAFLLGYCSHLVADQGWITSVFRPYFANARIFADFAEAKVLDRALQLEEERSQQEMVRASVARLQNAEMGVEVPFVDAATLKAWREWVVRFLDREFTWERLRFMSRRRQEDGDLALIGDVAERFLTSVPDGLAAITQRVPQSALNDYRTRSEEVFQAFGRGFLKCV